MGEIELQFTPSIKRLQLLIIRHLTLHKCKHTIANSQYWEMLVLTLVVFLGPVQHFLYGFGVDEISVGHQRFRISRNIKPIQIPELSIYFLGGLGKIYWYDSCAS